MAEGTWFIGSKRRYRTPALDRDPSEPMSRLDPVDFIDSEPRHAARTREYELEVLERVMLPSRVEEP